MSRERNVGLRPHRISVRVEHAADAPDTPGGNASVNERVNLNDHDFCTLLNSRVSAFARVCGLFFVVGGVGNGVWNMGHRR